MASLEPTPLSSSIPSSSSSLSSSSSSVANSSSSNKINSEFCISCLQKISGNSIENEGASYHPHCFQQKIDSPGSLTPPATSSLSSNPSPSSSPSPSTSSTSSFPPKIIHNNDESGDGLSPLPSHSSKRVLSDLVLPGLTESGRPSWTASFTSSPVPSSPGMFPESSLLRQEFEELKLAYDSLVDSVREMVQDKRVSAVVVTLAEFEEQALALREAQEELDLLKRKLANNKESHGKPHFSSSTLNKTVRRNARTNSELQTTRAKLISVSKELLETKAHLGQEIRARQLAEETVKRLTGFDNLGAITMGFEIDANKSNVKSNKNKTKKEEMATKRRSGVAKDVTSMSTGNLTLAEKRRSAPVSTSLDNLITFGIEKPGSNPHHFETRSSIRPLKCGYCEDLIWATGKKAMQCKGCKLTVHQRCCQFLPPNCEKPKEITKTALTNVAVQMSERISFSQMFFDTPIVRSKEGVFGVDLAILCSREKRSVPVIVVKCISIVEMSGLSTPGIYRNEASAEKVQQVRDHFLLSDGAPEIEPEEDALVLATALRYYLAELPDPLLTHEMYDDFLKTDCIESNDLLVSAIRACVQKLPHNNYDTFRLLMIHLHNVLDNPSNGINAESLAIVFAPLVLRPLPETALSSLLDRQVRIRVFMSLLENYSALFNLHKNAENWKVSFEELVSDPIGLHVFSRFCQSEYSEENVSFWMDSGNYRRLTDSEERLKKAKHIYNRYIKAGAIREINVSDKIRPVLEAALKDPSKCTAELLDDGSVLIYELMANDSYKRFLRSPIYLQLLE